MAYTREEIQKIYNELEIMSRNTGHPMISMDDLTAYLNEKSELTAQNKTVAFSGSAAKKQIKEMIMVDLGGAEQLGDVFKSMKDANEEEMASIARTAAQKEKKLINSIERQKIRDAKAQLEKLNEKQAEADVKRHGGGDRKRLPYRPAEERKQHPGGGYWNPLRFILAGTNFGTHMERHRNVSYPKNLCDQNKNPIPQDNSMSRDISYRTSDGLLKGHQYFPPNFNPQTGKVVLYFGGSSDPAAATIEQNTGEYLKNGAAVINFDPRGFGKSESLNKNGKKTGTKFSEESMYKDAREMYNYVVKELHIKPENIIIHGYSLGGAMASRLAADISEKNQIADTKMKKTTGMRLSEGMRLGGIVLQSPIDSNYNAAKRAMGGGKLGSFAGSLTWLGDGGFNTKSHMERLHKFDPNIPVYYTGGTPSVYADHLSPGLTEIDKNPNAQFVNSNTSIYKGDHDTGLKEGDIFIKEIAKNGRHAEIGVAHKLEHQNNNPQVGGM